MFKVVGQDLLHDVCSKVSFLSFCIGICMHFSHFLLLSTYQVNDMDMAGVTREEAVLYLMSLQNQIDLIVQTRKHEYESILNTQKGDLFYIK